MDIHNIFFIGGVISIIFNSITCFNRIANKDQNKYIFKYISVDLFYKFSISPLAAMFIIIKHNPVMISYGIELLLGYSMFITIMLFIVNSKFFIDMVINVNDTYEQTIKIIYNFIKDATGINYSYNSNRTVKLNTLNYSSRSYSSSATGLKSIQRIKSKGFLGYDHVEEICIIAHINSLTPDLLVDNLTLFINNLEENKIYQALPVIIFENEESANNYSITQGVKLTKLSSVKMLSERLSTRIERMKIEYQGRMTEGEVKLVMLYKEWLTDENYNGFVEKATVVNKETEKSFLNSDKFKNLTIPGITHHKIMGKYSNIHMDEYGELLDGYHSHRLIPGKMLEVTPKVDGNLVRVLIKDLEVDSTSSHLEWTDRWINPGIEFVREWDSLRFYYLKGLDGNWDISKIENTYNFPNILVSSKTTTLDTNFGSLDLETLAVSDKGLQKTYAGGWTNGQVSHRFLAQDINDPIVITLINSIFDYISIKPGESKLSQMKRNGMTLWAHNLGRFDSVEIIKGLLDVSPENNPYEIKSLFKSDEGKVLSITITEKKSRNYIKIKDSISFFNFMPLDKVFKAYDIDYVKGQFPHTWVTANNLNYIGTVPSRSYYPESLTDAEYNNLSSPWNFRAELDKYLEADVNGLYEAISLVHKKCFDRYHLNMTDFLTLPSFAMAIFSSNYYDEGHEIKVIKGVVESEIRSAYYGGMVQNLAPKEVITKGEAYDMNSQYPNSMLQDMPVGDPTWTDVKDLDQLFGFTYGKVIPPRDLKVLLIRDRLEGSGVAIYPRTPFKRMIFTEEIREALKYGYQFEVEYSYNFKRGLDVFADYVHTHYKDKKEASDPTIKSTSKLLLNSLYGKFGTKDIESTMKVITRSAAKAITKNYNYDFVSPINEFYTVVKYRSRVSERVRNFYNEDNEEKEVKHTARSLSKPKVRGVQSSISIAAAIGGYSAASMFKYMNIPDNPLLYIDTDGVVLTKSLEDTSTIGPNLGQMKHEYRGGEVLPFIPF